MKKQWTILQPDGMPVWDEKTDKPAIFNSFKAARDEAADRTSDDAGGHFRIFECVAYAVMPLTKPEIRPIKNK